MINEKLLKNEELAVYRLRSLYSDFGYTLYKMSKFEEYDLYVRNKDFLISDRIITFTDTNGKLLALKPDVTLSIINNFSANNSPVQKMYYNENVYRVSGSTGKFKEIMQTGLECIGKIGIYEITEVVYLAVRSLALIDDNFAVELSHAGLLQSLFDDMKINESTRDSVSECIRIKSSGKTDELLSEGKISDTQADFIRTLYANYSSINAFCEAVSEFNLSEESKRLLREFSDIFAGAASGRDKEKLFVNFSISADAGYYSGVVFKGYINGIPESVLSGGQYDSLMKKLGSQGSAIGFAVYLDSFERFGVSMPEYDVDTVLLIGENDDPVSVLRKVEELREEGGSVSVRASLPDDIRYRRVIKTEA